MHARKPGEDPGANKTGAPRRHSIDSPDAEVLLPPAAVRYRSPGAGPALEQFLNMEIALSETASTTAAPAAASASPAASATIGAAIDAEVVLVKARLAALEAAGKTDWADVKAWVKTNWPHFVTWATVAASSAPALEFVKKLI